jgi:hypothetical protein
MVLTKSNDFILVPAGHHNMHLGWSIGMTQVQGDQDHGAWTWVVCVDPGSLGHMMDSPCAWAVFKWPWAILPHFKTSLK